MVSLNKTLIIFDTNALRHVFQNDKIKENTVIFHAFEFGSPFKSIEAHISDKHLTDYVKLAIPQIVIDELKKQKIRSYNNLLEIFSQIHQYIIELPFCNKQEVKLPKRSFNYSKYVNEMAEQFLSTKKINIIKFPEENQLKTSFQRIIERALDAQAPFRRYKDKSDVGFKDVLIWESILNYPEIRHFDKIILFTGDNGFSVDCIKEFHDKIKKSIAIKRSDFEVINEINKDYSVFIENYDLIKFANTEYFKDMLFKEISQKSILLKTGAYPIKGVDILDPSVSVETIKDKEDPFNENIKIKSKVSVKYTVNSQDFESIITVDSMLDEIKEVIEITFVPELVERNE